MTTWAGPRTLVLLDVDQPPLSDEHRAVLEKHGHHLARVDYGKLDSEVAGLRELVDDACIDFVLFARNDQVADYTSIGPAIRTLGVGYSSFGGIDDGDAAGQTAACLRDYIAALEGRPTAIATIPGFASLPAPAPSTPVAAEGAGPGHTFSLVFDMEQLACVRHGLPRVLEALAQHSVAATFFTTNVVHDVYDGALALLREHGHEVGLHGLHHEYLTGLDVEEQTRQIGAMRAKVAPGAAPRGANFVFRMDANTIDAMARNDLRYFVMFMEHAYQPFAYRRMPTAPMLMWSPSGTMWMVPISVETYNRPWSVIEQMLDAATRRGREQDSAHLSVLMHPFRDGSLRHVEVIGRTIEHMRARGYTASTLDAATNARARPDPTCYVLHDLGAPALDGAAAFWADPRRHQQRAANVYATLEAMGQRPAFCTTLPQDGTVYAVYPHVPVGPGRSRVLHVDPLDGLGTDLLPSPGAARPDGPEIVAIMPGTRRSELTRQVKDKLPVSAREIFAAVPEIRLRVSYRRHNGRHVH